LNTLQTINFEYKIYSQNSLWIKNKYLIKISSKTEDKFKITIIIIIQLKLKSIITIKLLQVHKGEIKMLLLLAKANSIHMLYTDCISGSYLCRSLTERSLTLKLLNQGILVASGVTLNSAIVTIYVILLLLLLAGYPL
jgi:hypothetical protein